MNTQLTSAHRLVLSILGLSVSAVTVAYFFSGVVSLLIAGTLCVLLWLLRPLLMPPGYGAMRVRMLSVLGAFGLAASYGFWSQLVDTAAKALVASPQVRDIAPWIETVDFGNGPSIVVLIFIVFCLWIVNHYMADRSIAGGHPVPMNADFPEEPFQKKLDSFCSALRQHLVTMDREANWSPDYYADLEAEVEIVAMAGATERRRIVDLQGAIRSDRRTQAFLVLGDPGAGKSVALRKLARDMLDEVGNTGRVPIYVNLREWLPKEGQRNAAWTDQSKPTIQELESFVVDNVKARGDVFTEEFVDKYFRELWRNGRLFFIFDSFDEIPELLDANEESWLINSLSDVLSRFISSNLQSRGILASRVFRRPTQAFLAQIILEIRPLSEERIMQALTRFPAFTQDLQISLFRERLDLIPIARNPFLMALLGEWVMHRRTLPQTQAQLYENYLKGRLAKCASKIAQHGLTDKDILRGAMEIAWFVFESPAYGLEAPVRVIDEAGSIHHAAAAVIDVLNHARIARVTPGEPKSFAFVHRRFLEYLVTMRFLDQPEDLPVEHIPTDSRGRDALVLYAQLCDAASADKLAALCWSEIQAHFDDPLTRLRAIHCLRFLVDAFCSRRPAVTPFASELAAFIRLHVAHGKDLIQAKICLEGTGLLSETEALPILNIAMAGSNSWLRETAFRACRHLPRLGPELEESIARYIIAMPLRQFWASRRALTFSLSLSESLKGVHRTAVLRHHNLLMSAAAALLSVVALPLLTLFSFLFVELDALTLYRSPAQLQGRGGLGSRALSDKIQRIGASRISPVNYDLVLEGSRLMCALFLIGLGASVAAEPDSFQSHTSRFREIYLLNLPLELGWTSGYIMMLLGVMLPDWLLVHTVARQIGLPSLKEAVKPIAFALGITTALLLLIVALNELGGRWMMWAMVALMYLIIGAFASWIGVCRIYYYIRDRRTFKRIPVANRMPRQDITAALDSLLTNYWRQVFVRQLAQERIIATGNWPAGFRLSVADDPVLTELAKLEERWLKLDR